MFDNHSTILEKAKKEGERRHPEAPINHHCAFANSVAYLVTGMSGGYGGPSIREHAVSHSMRGAFGKTAGVQANLGGLTMIFPDGTLPHPGAWEYEKALDWADSICYGEINYIHFNAWRTEYCFDDSPQDIEACQKFKN